MREEPETRETSRLDPSVDSHRLASGKSQDISHVLASTFKHLYTRDIIGKDTLSNLMKTKNGRSSYHDRYVEELQQAHSEYSRSMKEADMLESHIIQARARAAAKESRAYERLKEEMGDVCDHQGILTVQSAFSWCVDDDLLKMNNLISPQDYLSTQKPRVRPPAPIKSNPAKPTIAYTMHISREPQNDGYTLMPSPEKNESDRSLTLESSSDTPKRKKTPRKRPDETKPRPKWKGEPSAKDRAEGRVKLQKLKDSHNFLRNPRFLPPNAQPGGTSLVCPRTKVGKMERARKGMEKQSSTENPVPAFLAKPSEVVFTDYSVGRVYETTLELKNLTSASRTVRVIPPTTPYFSIGLGRFPGEGGVVAPGMSCKYTVRFAPDSLGDYEDYITVETLAGHRFWVPIAARRPPPILTLPRVLDCGCCLIGGVKSVEFLCKNISFSAGTFCIIPKNQWPASNLRSVTRTYFSEQPPFAVSPSLFALQPGEATVVEVVFFPNTAERSCQVFTVVCDNCHVKDISIEGEGQLIALELASVSGKKEPPVVGEVRDLTAEHFVRFSPCNPHSVQQKQLIIRNNVHLELPFHWQIMKPNLHPFLPGETPEPSHLQFHLATDDAFHVSPRTGVLPPCQDQAFLFTFCPKELKDCHSVCHLVLRDVPHLPPEPTDNGVLQPVRTGSKVGDVIVMEIELKGSTEPYQVLLEPYAVVIPGEISICSTTRRHFKMWNHSKTRIFFQWERMSSSSHIIEVEPSAGSIEENECFDFDLILSGGKPEKVVTSLVCYIEHRHEPVTLAVEVCFKGPIVTLSVPSVEFGLMKLGEQAQTTLLFTNITHLEASWTLDERPNSQQDHRDTQISVEPRRGVLPPLASCSVDVLFSPHFCQRYETELELTVENGTGCHLSVRADVQSPQVCLLNCELLFSELYIGVPAEATVTLFNQTLLPSHFSWKAQLQGKQAELCRASFDPSSGTLGPNASLEITVHFISHTDLDLTEVAALCEVQGMSSPLVVGIMASKTKKLSVSYSLPSVCSPPDDESPSTLLLDFRDDVVLNRAVTKQLLITNQTAIPAPFIIEADYFTCHASKPKKQSEKRVTYVKKPLHSVQAQKVEEKALKECVSSLLAHGKGAAFFVLPDSGMLGPFETQSVDVTAYTDMWGEYRDHLICKVGDLEPTLIPVQMTVTGCPLYFQMMGPRPDNQNQGPITQFGTHVSGGDTVSRSFRINNPTMFDIRMDWETYNIDQNDHKLVDVVVAYGDAFPVKDADGNEVLSGALGISGGNVQTAWERNTTRGSEGTSSSLRSMTSGEGEACVSEDDCEEEETCLYPSPAKKKLFSVHIRPHVGNLSDYPYCITPRQIVIRAKSSSTIHVSFTPLTLSGSGCESRCVGQALGFMSLDSEMAACVPGKVGRAQGLDLEPVRMDLLAVVKPAVLIVQIEEDGGVLEFHASAGDLLKTKSETVVVREFDTERAFQLRNNSEMPLHFRLGTQPPFRVLKQQLRVRTSTSSNPPTGDSQSLVLHSQQSMQVKVAFHCSLSLLDHADQAGEEVPPGVTLIHRAREERKLCFQQNLLIHYSNNSLQTVPLCAHLELVTMRLSSDSVDFGFCYVGQTQIIEVILYRHGAHTDWKSVTESDEGDSRVFRVTPDFWSPRSKERHVTSGSQCLQISFTPSEDREFRAIVVIQPRLVKTPLTLQLQGTGSFDEVYWSN
ncbi:deleted in lung and esophageal cancer protein 1 [Anarrhichthys ocellatus]|uniref:deleted in lung and esophageal cancer protein 1 n=1 Tax=Anarrhichthys ocellatus TaxID=433405 RepID=UPI0012EE3800|nr:deleted in lung and esophageal cancer protein 1 [Anarrhichthys ocellatus]